MSEFTKDQIEDFHAFEEVREEGLYNMFSPDARAASGLSRDEYVFVMKNYSALKQQSDGESNAK